MSKGSNSTTTNSTSTVAPSSAAMGYYNALLSRADAAASKPYMAYTGESVAPINSTQAAGVGNVNAMSAGFQPFAGQVGANIAEGGMPIDGTDLSRYYDPYTQQVIDATMADYDTMNQRANSAVTGNAAAQGALGGNRVGVAQALTQEGNTRTQAPVLASLRSRGFENAVQAAQADKTRALQSGTAATNLTNAQISAGTLEQQTKQAQDTQARADYFQQQGYDFATAQWLASIVLPTGAQMGSTTTGNSTTEGPKPNQWMQLAGLGLAAGSMFIPGAQAAAPGLAAAAMRSKDGGRIEGFANGGTPYGEGTNGYVPVAQVQGHPLQAAPFQAPKAMELPKDNTANMGKGLGAIGKGLYDRYNAVPEPLTDYAPEQDYSNPNYAVGPELPGFYNEATGGGIPVSSGFGGGFAEGGSVEPLPIVDYGVASSGAASGFHLGTDLGAALRNMQKIRDRVGWGGGYDRIKMNATPRKAEGGGLDDELSPNDAVDARFSNPLLGSDQYQNFGSQSRALINEGLSRREPGASVADDVPLPPRRPVALNGPSGVQPNIIPTAMKAFQSIQGGEAPSRALGFAEEDDPTPSPSTDISAARRVNTARYLPTRATSVERAPPGVAAPAPGEKASPGFPFSVSDEARQGLISMGLAMMANRVGGKGSSLSILGEGGQQGMTTYASAKAATSAQQAQARKETFEREKFNRPYQEMTAAEKERNRLSRVPSGYVTDSDGNLKFIPGGPADPATIKSNAEAKLPASLMTPQSLETAADVFRMTGKLPPNMGRGVQGAQEATMIRNRAAEKEADAGGDPADWAQRWQSFGTRAAGLRTLENRAAGLTLAENEARALVPRVRELLAKVNRTKYPDLNRLIIAGQTKTGNEDEIRLGIAIGSLIPVYARVLKPVGQVGQTDLAHAQHLLEAKWSTGQMGAALDQFDVELHAAKEALAQARKEYGESGPVLPKKKDETTPPATPKLSATDQQALDWANANPNDPRAAAIKKKLGVP